MTIHHSEAAPPLGLPKDYTGLVVLPGTGRLVYWTGRVAIGLLHSEHSREPAALSRSAEWLQRCLLERVAA